MPRIRGWRKERESKSHLNYRNMTDKKSIVAINKIKPSIYKKYPSYEVSVSKIVGDRIHMGVIGNVRSLSRAKEVATNWMKRNPKGAKIRR